VRSFSRLSADEKINQSLAQGSVYSELRRLPRIRTPKSFATWADYLRWKARQKHPIFR